MNMQTESILFVDDEPGILSSLRRLFRKPGYRCFSASSGEAGFSVLETVRMLLTGHSDISATIDALNSGGIYRYISKPRDDDELKTIVSSGLHLRRLEWEKAGNEWQRGLRLTSAACRKNLRCQRGQG